MAKIQYAEDEIPLNNKHGGYTFQKNRNGYSMFRAQPESRKRYGNQWLRMQPNQKAIRMWRNVGSSVQSAWEAFATTYPQYALKQPTLPLTGFQLFVKRNYWQFLNFGIDSGPILSPELTEVPAVTPTFSLSVVGGRLILSYEFDINDSTVIFQILLSRVLSPGVQYAGTKCRYVGFCINSINEVVKYGRLYNAYAFNAAAGFAPAGWHIPSYFELGDWWNYIGGNSVGGCVLKSSGTDYWLAPNSGATDSFGFSMRGAGGRTGFSFSDPKTNAGIWILPQGSVTSCILFNNNNCFSSINGSQLSYYGRSVRLIKDDGIDPGSMTGNDGHVYATKKIGDLVWTIENSIESKFADGSLIPNITNQTDWRNAVTPAYCYNNNDPSNSSVILPSELDITDLFVQNFGLLPEPGQVVIFQYLPVALLSGQFFPVVTDYLMVGS